jgi:hypothetical protein
MSQKFVKGRTNNHLTWVMVDATDFATPESALSAAMKIKIYGKLAGAAGVNFVSSGTGSLTNDIQHVGASALGIYTIALAKADLSDASAAWYDQYVVNLSATGAAYQTLVVEGGIDTSALLVLSDAVSNVMSAVLLTQSMASDAASAAAQANSRVLLCQSRISDIASYLVVMSGVLSDTYSAVSNINSLAIASPTASDIASQTYALLASQLSDTLSAAQQANSRLLVNQSVVSDIRSQLTAGVSIGASDMSDLRSAIGAGPAATITASDISDIASAVWANTIGARVDSRLLVVQSAVSDTLSRCVVIASMASDAASAATQINSRVLLNQSRISDIASAIAAGVTLNASGLSDVTSAILAAATAAPIAADIQAVNGVTIVGDGAATPWGP